MTTQIKIERKADVLKRLSISKATLHNYINDGIFPPSISLGPRAVGFFSHEVDATIIAMSLEEDLKSTVSNLVSKRADLMTDNGLSQLLAA
ncbi:AlpA family transcriptional regulator [uncultured Photobacterium sp.]|uniref:helix-turn-helix transcriptional regulator n=1 Tax=uncultured Photobacterium sp. TaxID=173973 RepID=UPI002632CD82|nr:AlpA family phage regulatory protein [uncultured Photobacterium sp.]